MFKQLGVDPSTFGFASNQLLGIAFQDTKKRTIESLSAMSVPESLRITPEVANLGTNMYRLHLGRQFNPTLAVGIVSVTFLEQDPVKHCTD